MALPLERLRFSTTNVTEPLASTIRNEIAEMGGQCRRNLEATTQFLVLGDLGRDRWSPKYNFTMEMRSDIVLVGPETVTNLHELWMSGQDFDGRKELEKRKLRPFEGLRVCLTNLPSTERKFITTIIQDNGGEAFDSLKADCHILVSAQDSGRKVSAARHWQIPVVVPEWVIKSLERGYAWSPEMFLIHLAPEERKKSLCSDAASTIPTSMSGSAAGTAVGTATKHRRPLGSDSAWNSLMSMPSAKRVAVDNSKSMPVPTAAQRSLTPPVVIPRRGVFDGLTFSLYGFDKRQQTILEKTLESHDAKITDNLEASDYCIVYSQSDSAPKTDAKVVTEWAIERSLHKKERCLDDFWGTFVQFEKIKDFEGLEICLSGFSGVELLHLSRLIPLVGGTFCETLTSQRDLLISTPTSNKFKHAQSWDVPIVSERWLWACAEERKLLDLTDYVLEGTTSSSLARRLNVIPVMPLVETPIEQTSSILFHKRPTAPQNTGIVYDDETESSANFVEIKPAVNARRRI